MLYGIRVKIRLTSFCSNSRHLLHTNFSFFYSQHHLTTSQPFSYRIALKLTCENYLLWKGQLCSLSTRSKSLWLWWWNNTLPTTVSTWFHCWFNGSQSGIPNLVSSRQDDPWCYYFLPLWRVLSTCWPRFISRSLANSWEAFLLPTKACIRKTRYQLATLNKGSTPIANYFQKAQNPIYIGCHQSTFTWIWTCLLYTCWLKCWAWSASHIYNYSNWSHFHRCCI